MSKRVPSNEVLSPREKLRRAKIQVAMFAVYAISSLMAISWSFAIFGDWWFLIPLTTAFAFWFIDARHYLDGFRYIYSLDEEASVESR